MQGTKEVNGRAIAFPAVTSFAELFTSVEPAKKDSRVLESVPSWDAGSWSDPAAKNRSHLAGRVYDHTTAFDVIPSHVVLNYWRHSVLHCSDDRMYFEVHRWSDGTALVTLQHNIIIGSHYLAVIDASTLPT